MAEEYRMPTLGSLQGDSISDSLVAEEYRLPTLGRSGDHESAEWHSQGLRLHLLFVQLHVTKALTKVVLLESFFASFILDQWTSHPRGLACGDSSLSQATYRGRRGEQPPGRTLEFVFIGLRMSCAR